MELVTSQNGIELIKAFEGCVLTAYQDAVGVWTIGYGHTNGVYPGMCITSKQAEDYLISDLQTFETTVNQHVKIVLTQNMFDALISFAFNVGSGAFKRSTLLARLNKGDTIGAANEFDRWIYAGKKILRGLKQRRSAEKGLFLNGLTIY